MRLFFKILGTALILAGPVVGQEETLNLPRVVDPWADRDPWTMGTIVGVGDGDTITWTTYDFSVGTIEASAWVTWDDNGSWNETVSIVGYTTWDDETNRIWIKSQVNSYEPGTYEAQVMLIDEDRDVPRQKGLLTMNVTEFREVVFGESYGHFKATLDGTICSVQTPTDCFVANFTVDTELQFGY